MGWLYSGLGISAAAKAVHEGLRWRVLVYHCGSWRHSRRLLGKKECLRVFFLTFHALTGIAVCRSVSLFLSLFFLFFSVRQKRSHIRKIVATFAGGTVIFSLVDCLSHHEPVLLCHRSICATAACWFEEIPAVDKDTRAAEGCGGWGGGGRRGEREKKTPEPKPKLSLTY